MLTFLGTPNKFPPGATGSGRGTVLVFVAQGSVGVLVAQGSTGAGWLAEVYL